MMQKKVEDRGKVRRETLQLIRLERLFDVVFAIMIWRTITLFPTPTDKQFSWEQIGPFLSANLGDLVLVLIGILAVIIFWRQNNLLFGNLRATDNFHTIISILQIFFLLIFIKSLRMGVELEPSPFTRTLESFTAALVGVVSSLGWWYAIKNRRLLSPEVTDQYALQLRDRSLAEPLTALITLPLAFVGATIWEISWWSYPLVVWLVKRRRRTKMQ